MKIFYCHGCWNPDRTFSHDRKNQKMERRLAMLCTLLLIFSMGVMLGQKENFLSELSSLGLKSFLFFLIPTLVSIISCLHTDKTLYGEKALRFRRRRQMIVLFTLLALVLGLFCGLSGFNPTPVSFFKPALRYDFIHTDVFCGNQHRNAQRHPQKNPPVSSENPYYPPWHYSGLCHRRADLRSDPGYFSGRGRCCGKRNGLVQSCGSYHQPSGRRGTGKYCLYEQSYERIFLFFPNSHYCLQAQ